MFDPDKASLTLVPSGNPSAERIRKIRADPLIKPGETYLLTLPDREPELLVSPFHDRVWKGFLHYLNQK